MTDAPGEFWRAVSMANQTIRQRNQAAAPARLTRAGLTFETRNDGAHLIVQATNGKVVDYWPGTGLWKVRPNDYSRRGIWKLIQWCTSPYTASN